MTLHIVGLPHTRFTPEYSWCAYTTKVQRFVQMMQPYFDTITYGNGDASLPGKYIAVTNETQPDNYIPDFDSTSPIFANFNALATAAIYDHITDNDTICIIGGLAQAPISWSLPQYRTVEYGIGYQGCYASNRVFESHAWHHIVCGEHGSLPNDVVIPNYFDLSDFARSDDRTYFAFMGRVCHIKGIDIAIEACRRANVELKIAGHVYDDADYVRHLSDVEYVGELTPADRKEFLSHSIGVLCPTRYGEPFCGVHVEAMLSGSVPITANYGAFTETITNDAQGYRCDTLDDYTDAIHSALNEWSHRRREYLASHAAAHYSMDVIAPQYYNYLERLQDG